MMQREEEIMSRHWVDLANQASQRDIITFSSFLTPSQAAMLRDMKSTLYATPFFWGGHATAERQAAAFVPDSLLSEVVEENGRIVLPYGWEFPMICLKVEYKSKKFAQKLDHRDVLGALMNLGIERDRVGDILFLDTEKELPGDILIMADASVAELIKDSVHQIRRTQLSLTEIPFSEIHYTPKMEEHNESLSSDRLDVLIAAACRVSRSQVSSLLSRERVSVNGKTIMNASYTVRPGDIISVRGFGKLKFIDFTGTTKKGKLRGTFAWYR